MEIEDFFSNFSQSNFKNKLDLIKSLMPSLLKANEYFKLKEIFDYLQKQNILPNDMDYNYFRNQYYKLKKGERMNNITTPKVIGIVNFKGGVGKSTIANLLELPDKIILNLDIAQDAKKINTNETYNFHELKEEYGIDSVKEAILGAIEGGKNNIILDTPGEISDFIETLPLIDYFIIPFNPANRSINTTLTTIETINSILDDMVEKRKDKWCIVLNRYISDSDLEELEELYNKAKKILNDKLICKTKLKNSQVISTIERKRKTLNDLIKENPIAYGTFKKRIKELNKDLSYFFNH